jgi:predicted RND superfamily exporter protein
MRDKLLIKLARWHANKPFRMLLIAIFGTILLGILAGELDITMRWSDLLPENDPRTIQFNKIIDEFVSSTSLVVLVQGDENRIKDFSDHIASLIINVMDTTQDNRKLIKRIDYKSETDFLKKHGLMLIKKDELEDIFELFTDPNLVQFVNNISVAMEKEYVGRSESISTREREDRAYAFLSGIESLIQLMSTEIAGETSVKATVDELLVGEGYFLSYNKTALILNVIPNFTMMDADLMVLCTDLVQEIVDRELKNYPDITAGLTGMIAVGRDEMVYSEQSLGYTSLIAMITILVLLIISFRMWIAPVFASINLFVGIIWAMGIVAVVVGQLNIMTSMMTVILLGLGIDFAIHIISGFTERRALGEPIAIALEQTFLKSGKGVLTGAFTTSFAFLTMIISSSRGMKEMGVVTGLGLLAIMLVTFLLLPTLLVLREKRRQKKMEGTEIRRADISFRFLGRLGAFISERRKVTLVFIIILTGLLVFAAIQIEFDHNYMNIEPEGLTSIILQDTILYEFDLSMDYALILTDNVSQSRQLSKKFRELSSVAITEDISLYLPSEEEQATRREIIHTIVDQIHQSKLKKEISPGEWDQFNAALQRLLMNIVEMQDMAFLGGQDKVDKKCTEIIGHPLKERGKSILEQLIDLCQNEPDKMRKTLSEIQKLFAPYFQQSVLFMADTSTINLSDLPNSILDRYVNANRDQFLITVFPAGNIWQDAQFLDRFVEDVEQVSERATGMPPVFRALMEIIGRDGRKAVLLTLIMVFFLLLIDFRHAGDALLAMIPLIFGIFWMVGIMHMFGLKLTVMNVMGLPMILGIGIDDGVHIVHRWRHEGNGRIPIVFASTGKAIMLTSLTTMLAFGSLLFSIWRGFGQLGSALFIGVAACFVATVVILPALIGWIEKKKEKHG